MYIYTRYIYKHIYIYIYIFATISEIFDRKAYNGFTVMYSLKRLCLFILKILGKIFIHLDVFLCDFLN